MKFSFVFLLLLDFPQLNGQERIKEFESILLRLDFPPIYNGNIKICCKLFPSFCYPLMDSTGFIYEPLRGRVNITEGDGWIEFKISNVRLEDEGYYRCYVLGIPDHIYIDTFVKVTESSVPHSPSQPPLTTTIKSLSTSTSVRPESTGPVLSQDSADSLSVPWSFSLPLLVVVSIAVMIVITLIMGVVCYTVKAKPEKPDKCGETLCESQKQDATETSGVVYSMVTFRDHQESTEVYANADTETVEYSALAIHW